MQRSSSRVRTLGAVIRASGILVVAWLGAGMSGCFTTSDIEPPPPSMSVAPTAPPDAGMPVTTPPLPSCTLDGDCASATAVCVAGQCLDQDCISVAQCPDIAVCDLSILRCVECVADQECSSSGRVCTANRCVEACTSDATCLPLVCSPGDGHCVDCDAGHECPTGFACTLQRCLTDSDAGTLDAGEP